MTREKGVLGFDKKQKRYCAKQMVFDGILPDNRGTKDWKDLVLVWRVVYRINTICDNQININLPNLFHCEEKNTLQNIVQKKSKWLYY